MKESNNNDYKYKAFAVVAISLLACIAIIAVELLLQPSYVGKSAVKVILFFFSIAIYHGVFHLRIQKISVNKRILKLCICLSVLIFFMILLSYMCVQNYIDVDQIKTSLLKKEHITKYNFIYVAVYISLINSFIEEAFFRGFVFCNLKEINYCKFDSFYSALLFALYHIGIMSNWFQPFIFLITLLALFGAGLVLNCFTHKGGSFLCSWPIHIAANLGINAVGIWILWN